jgi:hypothetical protein
MSKHTPGPWIFGVEEWVGDPWRDEPVAKPVAKPFDYSGPGHYDNPSIFGADGNEIVGCDEHMVFRNPADIRLLVAAPDLLEALISFTKSAYIKKQHPKRYAAAIAAIAKAEGKA